MKSAAVSTATAEAQDRIVSTIVLAFVRDPVLRWMWPEAHQYVTYFPEFIKAFGGKAFEHDSAHYAAEFSGAGLWLPPGIQPDEEVLVPLVERTVEPARLDAAFATLEQMGTYHPSEPHWYLPLIGVDTAKQGRGHGSALLAYALERVDRERRPAYLESTNPANVPLYQRHGFEVVGTIQVGEVPPMIPMIRPPR
jgi:ribosomal protein S18 acetylase RimI-like enzyme